MKLSPEQFKAWDGKCVTLLGMSGVGKTVLASRLRRSDWFHYSADYRIGTRYLDEPILDNIKKQAMQVPFLRDLLRSDSIYISNNITFDNLRPLSTFLGMLGDPELGGLPLEEFKRRQALHREAEIAAMRDVPEFIRKAREVYGYRHFVNDSGGSLCELDEPSVIDAISKSTLIVYIRATERDETKLVDRAATNPKPLYYRDEFLTEALSDYMRERSLEYVALIEPDDFARWVFPRLFRARVPRYERIAEQCGYTVTTDDIYRIRDEADFLELLAETIAQAAAKR